MPGALTLPPAASLTMADKWILTRLHDTIVEISRAFGGFDFGTAAGTIWRFVWYEFCDWYVEATKDPANVSTRAAVLSFVWNNAMRLLHPIAPFISEEVWLALPHDGKTIMTATWPDPLEVPVDRDAVARFESLRAAVERIRNLRAEMGLQPKERIAIDVPANAPDDAAALLARLANADVRRVAAAGATFDDAIAATTPRAPKGVLRERYRKEVDRLRVEVERLERKLENGQFVAKAAPDVVAKERSKLEGYRLERERVESALAALGESAP
jgi:valyl-tRNA synthetase